MVRERIQFLGRVQGVGFRYTCATLAGQQGLTGWVRNEPNGTVLAEFQGEQSQIDAVVTALGQGHFIRIDNLIRNPMAVKSKEKSFRITN